MMRNGALLAVSLSVAGCSTVRDTGPHVPKDPQKVRFPSGDSYVVGNIYLPASYDSARRYPAIVVGGSLTSVKEQMSGRYAAEMARRGFIALAIDYRHYGESGGEPRQYEDADQKAEDLSASVTYLATRPDVRPRDIGLLGICTSGGNVLYAAARDPRVAAVATVAGHFPEPSVIESNPVYGGAAMISKHRADGRTARERYERTGVNTMILAYSNVDSTASHVGPMAYYMDKARGGGVNQWRNEFSALSWNNWLAFDPVSQAARVIAPTLIVHSDGSAMPEQARKVYGLLGGDKELHWTGGDHFEFYDGVKVPEAADATAAFFAKHLAAEAASVTAARRFFSLLHDKSIDAWAELWADEGRILVFYPAEGFPSTIDGKAQIVAGFRTLFANFESFDPTITAVYPAADSDAVIVEYDVRATIRGGVEYTNKNIAVFRFSGGKIIAYHDYFDPRRFQTVVSALPKT